MQWTYRPGDNRVSPRREAKPQPRYIEIHVVKKCVLSRSDCICIQICGTYLNVYNKQSYCFNYKALENTQDKEQNDLFVF